MIRRTISAVLFLAFLASVSLIAQTFRGGVAGTVTDASGASIAGASVKLVSPDTGLTRESLTSSAGDFVFQDLPLGKYDVTVTQSGFDSLHVSGVTVDAGRLFSLALKLEVSRQATTVEVAASQVELETASSAETSVIPTQTLLDVPLNGRDFTQLLKLNPGVNANGSINGSRFNGIDWKIDGADNNDEWHNVNAVNQGGVSGIAGVLLPIDAIDEFSLQSGSNAEEGRNSGGVLNLVIKSGTNDVHGSLYYFNRNEALAARNWFTPPDAPTQELRNNQEGGSLGGPIWKNHTFFFLTYEQQNYIAAQTAVGTTPSAAWVSLGEQVLAKNGVPVNPVALNLLGTLWPANSLTGPATTDNYSGAGNNISNSYNGIVKLDHQFNERNSLAFRYFGGTGNQTEYIGSAIPYYFQAAPSRMHNFSLVYNSVISPRLVAQTVAGVNYFKQVFGDANHGFDIPALGLNTGVTNPSLFGSPSLTIAGFDGLGLTPPLGRIDTTGHITQTFTYTVSTHQFRFGGEYRHMRLDVFYESDALGSFKFDGSQGPFPNGDAVSAGDTWNVAGNEIPASQYPSIGASLNSLADFLAGRVAPLNATIAYGDLQRNYILNGGSGFFQDTWKVRPSLTLNYGLNWTYQSPISDPTNHISTFIPADGGITYVGHGISTLWPRDLHDFGPRFGFAYQPKAGGKMVIRGGYGIYYQVPNVSYFGNSVASNGGATGILANPGGSSPVYTLSNYSPLTIQDGAPIFASATLPPPGPYGAFSVSQQFVTGYSMNTNFNVQYQVAQNAVVEVGYAGSQSRHMPDTLDINQIPIGSPEVNSSRPYAAEFPNLGAIDQVESVGNSYFNALEASVRTTRFHGVTTKLSYTLGHSRDDLSYARGIIPQDSYDLKADYGNSDFDIRNSSSAFISYALPDPSRYKGLLGGWQLNSLFTMFSGTPFTVYSGTDTSGTGEYDDRAEVIGNPFANVPASNHATGTMYWFNPAAFALPAQGTYSNETRNEFYGPATHQIDFSLFKNFKVKERVTIQFRAEIFNLFNFRNLSEPVNNVSSSSLGQITSTYDVSYGSPGIGTGAPRNVQLALKVIF